MISLVGQLEPNSAGGLDCPEALYTWRQIDMCRYDTTVATRIGPRGIDSQHDFPCSWQFHLELAPSFTGNHQWSAFLVGEDWGVISRSTFPGHEGRGGCGYVRQTAVTAPSLRRGWKIRTHGACSETSTARVLSQACLAKHVRLQLMLGGKVTLAGAVMVRRRVSRD